MSKYTYNPNKNSIEYDGEFVAYLIFDEFLDFLKKKKQRELNK